MSGAIRIGHGAYGHVYLTRDQQTGSPIAEKRFTDPPAAPEEESPQDREAWLLAQACGARHVVQFRNYLDNKLVMDAVFSGPKEIKDVYEQLHEGKTFLLSQIASCANQLLEALSDLQERGIVHADIKHANVIFNTRSGIAKLLDFSNSEFIEDKLHLLNSTTYIFAPPESHFENLELLGYPIDMWSLGVTLFYMYTKRYPFGSNLITNDKEAVVRSIVSQLGIPSKTYMDQCQKEFAELQDWYGAPWETVIQDEANRRGDDPRLFLDFLHRIFCYEQRLSVTDGLAHPFCQQDICVRVSHCMSRSIAKKATFEIGELQIPVLEQCVHLPKTLDRKYDVTFRKETREVILSPDSELELEELMKQVHF